ncbi:MAG: M48 family metalloprotease [Armatimonadota bacterium]|nr:M48 family metalloprotease [Armatimonadota bacterium]
MRLPAPQAHRVAAGVMLVALLLGWPAAPAAAALISQEDEIRIGREAAVQLEAEVGLSADQAAAARLRAIGRRVATVSSRRSVPYTFKVIRGRDVNAISLPGGFIYATEALMRFVASDAELAFVMGHEVAHVAARHHVALLERELLLGLLSRLLLGPESNIAQLGQIARALVARGYSRENEYEADRVGIGYAHRAGFDASAALDFMMRLRAAEGRDPDRFEVLLRTHPALLDRIQRARDELRALGYRVPARP